MASFLHPPGHPPADSDADADADRPASCLLARTACIDSRTNASTACCDTDDKDRVLTIQITFVVAHPPRVSYFCAYCAESPFSLEPIIVHTAGALALLYMGVHKYNYFGDDQYGYGYYIYHADGGSNGEPSLRLLPRPSDHRHIYCNQIGLLPGGTHDAAGSYSLRPHGYSHSHSHDYHVAALMDATPASTPVPGQLQFDLYLFSSKTQTWTVKKPVLLLDQQQQVSEFCYNTCKVIIIGGECGTMGFVDYSRGILFCNVLQGECPHLYYVPLPMPLHPSRLHRHDSWRVCDVAVDTKGNRIRYVELLPRDDTYGWQAVTWSTSTTKIQEGWSQDCRFRPSQLGCSNLFELLPKVLDSDDRGALPTLNLERVYIELPALSLHADDTVYFLIKRRLRDMDEWVIAVDMANTRLLGVALCREGSVSTVFEHSRISNYLNMSASPGAKRNLKRPGAQLLESSRKKQSGLSRMDGMVSSWVCEQEQQQDARTIMGAQDGDNMDLDMPTLLKEHQ